MVSLTSRSEAFTVKLPTFFRSYQPWTFECCFSLNNFVLKLSHIGSIWIFELWKLSFWFRIGFFHTEHLSMGSRFRSSEVKRNCGGSSCKWLSLGLQIGFISTSFFWLSHSHILLKISLGLCKFKVLWICFFNFCFGKSSVKFEVFLWSDTFYSKVIHLLSFMISREMGNVCSCLNSICFYRLAKGRYTLWNKLQIKDY